MYLPVVASSGKVCSNLEDAPSISALSCTLQYWHLVTTSSTTSGQLTFGEHVGQADLQSDVPPRATGEVSHTLQCRRMSTAIKWI